MYSVTGRISLGSAKAKLLLLLRRIFYIRVRVCVSAVSVGIDDQVWGVMVSNIKRYAKA